MKQKINLRLALIAIIAVVASTIGVTAVYYNLFLQQVRSDLRINAELLRDSRIFDTVDSDGTDQADTSLLGELENDDLRITWVASDGSVLYDNGADASELTNHLDRPEIQQALENGYGETVRQSDTMNLNTFYYAILLDNGTVVRVAMQARTITSIYFAVTPVVLIIIAIIILICILIGHYLTKQLLKPVAQMTEHLDDPNEISVYKELQPFQDKIRSQHENILAAVRSRQDFTANVSHELKTPLTAISGYAELLENNMIEPEQIPHVANQIHRNADRQLSLINDIIQLSELDHSEADRHFTTVDLYKIAIEVCEDLSVTARKRSVSLFYRGEMAEFSADPALIRELVENLVQNAILYNKPYGKVEVEVFTDAGHPELAVIDTGIGIPKDQQERVFERFYRVDKSRSRETGGTGLGMAIVKHIAEIHGAAIHMKSDVGVGTEIRVKF